EAARRDAQARFEQGGDAEPMLESEDGEESEEESSASRRLPRSRGDAGNRLARLSDEVSRLVNSTMHAYLTELRATADVAGALVDAMLPSSSGPGKRPVTSGVNTRKELSSALLEAADRALDIPTEAVDRFYESYHSARRTRSRSRSPARP
ncbi:MAG TPA: hypothetical protein VE219_05215, partial [Candidatus Sulfotelmatobacter sp.]|nr:hypothetical protein [Candidatus Sulfotelmatobacter sp.]